MGTARINGELWGYRAEDWADLQEGQCAAVYEAVLDRLAIGPGMACLDAGCGAGMVVKMMADRGARASGIDASAALLGIARRRTPSADLRQGEIEDLPYPAAAFDAVTGFNSFQFAADPRAALAEAGRVAKPGATVAVMTWANPEGMPAARLVSALRPLLPPPPQNAPGPFALSDPEALRALAASAGLEPQDLITVDCTWSYPDLPTALRALKSPGMVARALEHLSEETIDAANTAALEPFGRPDGSYRVAARFQCLFAKPPG
jgi:SAM-dependent methyltransferase